MASPQVPLGNINRLLASISIPGNTALNVTASFLTAGGIDISFNGQATDMIPAMTGAVTSPAPYVMATITANLLKTQQIAQLYKNQMETSTLLGAITVRPDVSSGLGPYVFQNCAIESVSGLNLNGSSAAYVVQLSGTYFLNSSLYT